MNIVLPRALHFHYLHAHWKAFLDALGCEVRLTPPTNRSILERGARLSLTDLCLPLKVFLGHVHAAREWDAPVWVPRLVSRNASRTYCPKFLALPDIVRAKFPTLEILTVEINEKKGAGFTERSFIDVAKRLGRGAAAGEALAAAHAALARQEEETRARLRQVLASGDEAPRVAVVGHPYTVGDAYASSGVVDWLHAQGVGTVTAEMIPPEALERVDTDLFRPVYWECAHTLTHAAIHFLQRSDLDGMILLSAFGCGPDSFISDIVGRRARVRGTIPFVRLLLDEHTAQTGLHTRLEAFLDMCTAFGTRRGDKGRL